jgi:hypothetical protein
MPQVLKISQGEVAYMREDLVRMVAASPFGGAEVRPNDLGFDIVLHKPKPESEESSR